MGRELSPKQQKFIDVFDGNGTEAARLAGYAGNDNVLGKTAYDLLRNPKIAEAIRVRASKSTAPFIASRMDRQAFWTKVMNDPQVEMRDRLRASELLGKSDADFTENHKHEVGETLGKLIAKSYELEKKNDGT